MKIKKGDNVVMLGGKDKGKTGKVLVVLPENNRLLVEGLNMMKKHLKARQQGQKGQIVSKERAISVASVALVCKSCGKPTRVGFSLDGKTKSRVCKKCKATIA